MNRSPFHVPGGFHYNRARERSEISGHVGCAWKMKELRSERLRIFLRGGVFLEHGLQGPFLGMVLSQGKNWANGSVSERAFQNGFGQELSGTNHGCRNPGEEWRLGV